MENSNIKSKETLGSDLANTVISVPAGLVGGLIKSWIDPFAIMKEIDHIRNKGINSLSDYSGHICGAFGYGVGWYNIVHNVLKNPKDISNYAPLIINAISAGVQTGCYLYHKGKEKGRLEANINKTIL